MPYPREEDNRMIGLLDLLVNRRIITKQEATDLFQNGKRPITEKMVLLENWLLRDLQTRGVESQKTKEGTAFVSTVATATVKDRDALFNLIEEKNMYDL